MSKTERLKKEIEILSSTRLYVLGVLIFISFLLDDLNKLFIVAPTVAAVIVFATVKLKKKLKELEFERKNNAPDNT